MTLSSLHKFSWIDVWRISIMLTATLLISIPAIAGSALTFPGSKAARIGLLVRDLSTGIDVVSENADTPLTPASILKCITASSVLADDKADSRFQTIAYATGRVTPNGILEGNLAIRGVGDPTIESEYFPEYAGFTDSIASNLSRLGINRIKGIIEIDSSGFQDAGPGKLWMKEDLRYSYGAGLYAINYRDNTKPGGIADQSPGLTMTNALRKSLATYEIVVEGIGDIAHAASITPVYTHFSPTCAEILRVTLEYSDNLFAEAMLRILAPGQNLSDALLQQSVLQAELGLNVDNTTIYDGSGLSRQNSVTPRYMADMLQIMAYRPDVVQYMSFFPLVGEEGTVKKLLADTYLAGGLILKSGSMKGIQCYAGYKINSDGYPTHAVVVIVNDFTCQSAKVRDAISEFLMNQFPDNEPPLLLPM